MTTRQEAIDLEHEIDRLFQQPPGQFVTARRALASRLRAAERVADWERVSSLQRPTLAAWAANQIYWKARSDYERLIATGDRAREAQQASLQGRPADVRAAMAERQQALRTALDRALALAAEAGVKLSAAMKQRLNVTLDALASYGSSRTEPPAGRLTEEIRAPGFEALAPLSAGATARRAPGEKGRVIQMPARQTVAAPQVGRTGGEPGAAQQKARADAAAALKAAAKTVRGRQSAARRAAAAARGAARQTQAARATVERAEKRLDNARKREADSRAAVARAQREAEETAADLKRAEQRMEQARRTLALLAPGLAQKTQ